MISKSKSMYSSLTLILAICEGSCDSPQNKFSSFLTLHIVTHTSRHLVFVKINSTKWVTIFSWIFHFSLIDFSKKIIEFMWKVKKEENLFFEDSQLPSQIARTRVRLLYQLPIYKALCEFVTICLSPTDKEFVCPLRDKHI